MSRTQRHVPKPPIVVPERRFGPPADPPTRETDFDLDDLWREVNHSLHARRGRPGNKKAPVQTTIMLTPTAWNALTDMLQQIVAKGWLNRPSRRPSTGQLAGMLIERALRAFGFLNAGAPSAPADAPGAESATKE